MITAIHSEPITASNASSRANHVHKIVNDLRQWFGLELSLLDGQTGAWLHRGQDQPLSHADWLAAPCCEAARIGKVEFVFDEDPCIVLAIPLAPADGIHWIAVGAFLTRPVAAMADIAAAGKALGLTASQAATWAARQEVWRPKQLVRLAQLAQTAWQERVAGQKTQAENVDLAQSLSATYEEISLIYRLTQNLKISSREDELGQIALEWLSEVLPASGLALKLLPAAGNQSAACTTAEDVLLQYGECPVDAEQFDQLLLYLNTSRDTKPRIINCQTVLGGNWPFAAIRQLVLVPLTEGENHFGWLAAFNHNHGLEFGSVEANLLASVSAILGIHSSNVELYRQQAEFLQGVVRAMTSAIDAKDPYTCGHSDRVARVAVRLGKELDCDPKELSTLYMAGLLHDIGKIGVSDDVLRKPGKLTDHEFEHIKTHVEIGYRILLDLKQFDQVLPVVRHHHEAWNGAGYPQALVGVKIPYLARIVAVADAYDAMASDRPYRKGMSDERLDAVFRDGANRQWDPHVIEAFFRCRADIRAVSSCERDQLSLDVQQWS